MKNTGAVNNKTKKKQKKNRSRVYLIAPFRFDKSQMLKNAFFVISYSNGTKNSF